MIFNRTSVNGSVARLLPPSSEQIAALAHALWIDRGRPEGRDLEHWFEAERQLRTAERPQVKERPVLPASSSPDPVSRITRTYL